MMGGGGLSNILGLGMNFFATDNATAVMQKVSLNFTSLQKTAQGSATQVNAALQSLQNQIQQSTQGIYAGLGMVGAGAAGFAVFGKLTSDAIKWEDQMADIGRLLPDNYKGITTYTGRLQEYDKQLYKTSKRTRTLMDDTRAMTTTWLSLGYSGEQAIGLTENAALTSSLLGVASQDAADSLLQMKAAYQTNITSAEEFRKVMGMVNQIEDQTALSGRDAMRMFQFSGAVMSLQGKVGMRELLAMGAAARSAGQDITDVSYAFNAIGRDMEKTQKAFKSVGIQLEKADGSFIPLNEAFGQLSKKWASLSEAQKRAFPTDLAERYGRVIIPMIQSWGEYERAMKASGDETKNLAALQAAINREFGRTSKIIDNMKSAFQHLREKLGKAFLDTFKVVAKGLTRVFDAVAQIFESPILSKLAMGALFLVSALLTLGGVVVVVGFSIKALKAALAEMGINYFRASVGAAELAVAQEAVAVTAVQATTAVAAETFTLDLAGLGWLNLAEAELAAGAAAEVAATEIVAAETAATGGLNWVLIAAIAGALLAIVAAIKVMKVAWEQNFGGIRTYVQNLIACYKNVFKVADDVSKMTEQGMIGNMERLSKMGFWGMITNWLITIKVLFQGLNAVLTDNGMVTEELAGKLKALGLWNFVKFVYEWTQKIKGFFKGLSEGLFPVVKELKGTFSSFKAEDYFGPGNAPKKWDEYTQAMLKAGKSMDQINKDGVEGYNKWTKMMQDKANKQMIEDWLKVGKAIGHALRVVIDFVTKAASIKIVRDLAWALLIALGLLVGVILLVAAGFAQMLILASAPFIALFSAVKNLTKAIRGIASFDFAKWFHGQIEAVKKDFASLGVWISTKIIGAFNAVINAWNALVPRFAEIGTVPLPTPAGGGGKSKNATPTRAATHPKGKQSGGWVGLFGPEIVKVGEKEPEYVANRKQLESMKQTGGKSGGDNFTFHVTINAGNSTDPRSMAQQLFEEFSKLVSTKRLQNYELA